jgi:hypothetical protein
MLMDPSLAANAAWPSVLSIVPMAPSEDQVVLNSRTVRRMGLFRPESDFATEADALAFLRRSQFPPECATSRYLLVTTSKGAGLGYVMKLLGHLLATAVLENRVLFEVHPAPPLSQIMRPAHSFPVGAPPLAPSLPSRPWRTLSLPRPRFKRSAPASGPSGARFALRHVHLRL